MARRTSFRDAGAYNNPFDSDDEADRKSSRKSGPQKSYKNPFDDEGSDKKSHARRPQFESRGVERNPFSDGEEEEERKPPRRGNTATKLENGNNYRAPNQTRDFNEFDNTNNNNEGLRPKKGERFISHVKERAVSVGESAMKTAEKLKETSVNQAHKIGRIRKPSRSSSPEDPIPSKNENPDSLRQNQRDLLLTDEEGERERGSHSSSSSSYSSRVDAATRRRYKSGFVDSGGLEGQSVQELEGYAVYKAEETTTVVNNCLKVAENIREEGSKTLVLLHQQGEQITRTHNVAVDIDHDLSAGEKLLGNLGGIFSKKWKPTRSRPINGPVLTRDSSFKRRANHMEQRTALGLVRNAPAKSSTKTYPVAADTPQAQIEVEKAKQDDALSDLSNVLDQLKEMAIDMGSEIGRQNQALDPLGDDVVELSYRVKGANARGRRLLGK
uniref:TSA: Wollemia nobilis Ref_Wollemi_Transcript_11913_1873 transcribed RNA sequence n=1 Tax=Wollemia nobilis TaxID=56998 RepID=A0A0C9RLU5_9CONI